MRAQFVTFGHEVNTGDECKGVRMETQFVRAVYVPGKFFAVRGPYSEFPDFFLAEVGEDGEFVFTPYRPLTIPLPRRPDHLVVVREFEIPDDTVEAVARFLKNEQRVRALGKDLREALDPYRPRGHDDGIPF